MNLSLILKLIGYGTLGSILVGAGLYVLLLQSRVKDLERFKAESVALAKTYEENKRLVEATQKQKLLEIEKQHESSIKIERDRANDFAQRLRNANRSGSSAMPTTSTDTTRTHATCTDEVFIRWYTELLGDCAKTITECTETTQQLENLKLACQVKG